MRQNPGELLQIAVGVLCSACCAVLWLVPVLLLVYWSNRRRRAAMLAILELWARNQGLTLVNHEPRRVHPWMPWASRNQQVYQVVVRDADGQERRGWVRCGGWMLGAWSPRAEVRWDEAPRAPESSASGPPPADLRDDPLWDPWMDL
jgi:hypothetical protein